MFKSVLSVSHDDTLYNQVVVIPTFSSLTALKVVIMTTSLAISDGKLEIIATL